MTTSYKRSFKKFIAGGFAGAIAKTAIAPMDRVKLLFITNPRKFDYTRVIAESYRILHEEKIASFWKGNMAQLWRIIPYTAIQFASFDYYRNLIDKYAWSQKDLDGSLSKRALHNFLPGSLAGASAVVATYPFELARTRLAIQVNSKKYNGTFQALPSIYKQEGIAGLYRGITPTVIGILPYSGISFGIYFTLRDQTSNKTVAKFLSFGALAGLIGQFVTYPFDIVRKRMQAHGFIDQVSDYRASRQTGKNLNIRKLVREIWQVEGMRGFWKGFTMNLIKAPIGAGIVHATNEISNRFLRSEQQN